MTLTDKVYRLLKQVPKGRVTTYKYIGEALGIKSYQAIGQILKKNPYAPRVPCHRVVKNDGTIGGFMGKIQGKEILRKKKMLVIEGIKFSGNTILDFEKVLYKFS